MICGLAGTEDIAQIPGSRWLVGSGLNLGAPAHLYLIDDRTKRSFPAFPTAKRNVQRDPAIGSRCPAPPTLSAISTDGIGILPGRGGRYRLYAANHGGRRAIEIFRIDARRAVPSVTWIGCVPMPAGTLPNGVVPLRNGGFVVSSFYDSRDPDAWAQMERGKATGSIWEWQPLSGFRKIGAGISGANGLAVSRDERTLYVSAWGAAKLLTIDRRTGTRRELALDFLPDNIKWASDGSLLVAGQRSSVARIAACKTPACPQDWVVVRVDPENGAVMPLVTRRGTATLSYACSALQVGGTLYITARSDRRVAYLPMKSLPSLK